jgi:tetratricopeptide (TPR) repeat protein
LKTGKKLFIGIMSAVILLAVLSLTLLNKQSPHMRMTLLMREGRMALAAQDYDEAVELFRLAISLNERSAEAYMRLAAACIYIGELEDAIYFLELGMKKTGSSKLREAYNDFLKNPAVQELLEDNDWEW